MVYTLMTFGHRSGPEGKSPDWIREMIGAMRRIDVELAAPGELVYQQGRADASEARTVRAQVGIPAVVTDGPVHAPRTSLADFWVVGVKAEERAIESPRGPAAPRTPPSRCAGAWTRPPTRSWSRSAERTRVPRTPSRTSATGASPRACPRDRSSTTLARQGAWRRLWPWAGSVSQDRCVFLVEERILAQASSVVPSPSSSATSFLVGEHREAEESRGGRGGPARAHFVPRGGTARGRGAASRARRARSSALRSSWRNAPLAEEAGRRTMGRIQPISLHHDGECRHLQAGEWHWQPWSRLLEARRQPRAVPLVHCARTARCRGGEVAVRRRLRPSSVLAEETNRTLGTSMRRSRSLRT
jgi:hypothetical protein